MFAVFLPLVDISDIFYFFLFRGGGKEEASEEVAGGSVLCCLYARIDCAQCRSSLIEKAKQTCANGTYLQSSFCTRALGVLSQLGR